MTAADVAVRGVGVTFASKSGRVDALTGVDLSVEAGTFVAVVGRSGSGKSTLLRTVAGLVPATRGAVSLGGTPVTTPPPRVRYVFQDYGSSLLPWKTVEANVRFGLRHRYRRPGETRLSRAEVGSRARAHLDLVGLGAARRRYPRELSGGMQQRVAIARALSAAPDVLLMDEPFSAVDALSRAKLQDMLLRLWHELRPTVVFVTHDIDEAVYLADRVVVLQEGGHGVVADIATGLPRPRSQVTTRELPAFLGARRRLLELVLD